MQKTERQLKAIAKQLQSLALKVERLASLPAAKAPVKAVPKAKAKKGAKKAVAKKPALKKVASKKKAAKAPTVLDTVLNVVKKSKKGISIANIKKKAGIETRQLSNALYKLAKKGLIKTESRGIYIPS